MMQAAVFVGIIATFAASFRFGTWMWSDHYTSDLTRFFDGLLGVIAVAGTVFAVGRVWALAGELAVRIGQ